MSIVSQVYDLPTNRALRQKGTGRDYGFHLIWFNLKDYHRTGRWGGGETRETIVALATSIGPSETWEFPEGEPLNYLQMSRKLKISRTQAKLIFMHGGKNFELD